MAATIRILRLRPKRRPDNFVLFSSFSSSDHQPSNVNFLEEIRKKVADSRRRLSPPASPHTAGDQPSSSPSLPSKHISFQELYKRNVDVAKPASGKEAFDAIRNSLHMLREKNSGVAQGKTNDPLSLNKFTDSLRLRPGNPSSVEPPIVVGSDRFPTSILGKDIKDLKDGNMRANVGQEFVRNYTYQELGERLRSLSSDHKGKKNGFSIRELSDRLRKLRVIEEKESEARVGGVRKDLMDVLRGMKFDDEKSKSSLSRCQN